MKPSPKGWYPGMIETRESSFANGEPKSFDAKNRTIDLVISKGSPVARFYGTEVLRIHPDSIILNRVRAGNVPFLDSHQQNGISASLGRLSKVWFERGALMGRVAFNETPEGRKAMGMYARGELVGCSAGYVVQDWEISDKEGRVIDPEGQIRWDENLTFTATRWELLEVSGCTVPADADALVRSFGGSRRNATADVIFAMRTRMKMRMRQAMQDSMREDE